MQNSTVTVIGNLTRDPVFKVLTNGTATVTTGVAVNRRWISKDGSATESTSFYNVVGWGPMCRQVGVSLRKGDRVVIIGRLEPREWSDPEGDRHVSVEIVADEIAPSLRFAPVSIERRKPRPVDGPHDAGSHDGAGSDDDDITRPDRDDEELALASAR